MLQLLVCRRGWNEKAFAVSIFEDWLVAVSTDIVANICITYPAHNRPTILVPAIVAWHIGMTSCNSDSKMLQQTQHVSHQFVLIPATGRQLKKVEILVVGKKTTGISSLRHDRIPESITNL
jgi:hypothetical protein